jgi:hypothetical protein
MPRRPSTDVTVAHQLDDAAVVLCDRRIDDVGAKGLERRMGPRLVPAHHSAVADHVGNHDRGELAFHIRYSGRPALIRRLASLSTAARSL